MRVEPGVDGLPRITSLKFRFEKWKRFEAKVNRALIARDKEELHLSSSGLVKNPDSFLMCREHSVGVNELKFFF